MKDQPGGRGSVAGLLESLDHADDPRQSGVSFGAAIFILEEPGCVEDQPQRVDTRNSLVLCERAAVGRDDTAALRAKMRIADFGRKVRIELVPA